MAEYDRRAFLKDALKLSAGLAVAFNFGCSMRAEIEKRGVNRVAIIYASRYGATRDTVGWIAKGIGPDVSLIDIEQNDAAAAIAEHELLIIGSGVWTGGVHQDIRSLTANHSAQLQDKLLAVFVVCGTEPVNEAAQRRIDGYLQQITQPLIQPPEHAVQFGGRLVVEQLNDEDHAALTKFYQTYMKEELHGWDRTSPEKAESFGLSMQEKVYERMPT